jgi:hypothetical protein
MTTKLIVVAVPWATTNAAVISHLACGNRCSIRALTPTLTRNVVAYSATKPANRARLPRARKVSRRLSRYAVVVPAMKPTPLAPWIQRPSESSP